MRSNWTVQAISERSRGDYYKYEKQEKSVKVTDSEIDEKNTRDRKLDKEALLESIKGASGHGPEHLAWRHVERRERKQVPESLQTSSFILV